MEHPTGGIDFYLDSDSVLHAKCQRALQSLVSLHAKQKRARGQPRKHPREDEDLEVKERAGSQDH